MKLHLELTGEQLAEIARAVIAECKIQGMAMVEPERLAPYPVGEAAEALKVSERTVHRWVEAGKLSRVPGTARVLILADDVRRMQKGAAA